MSIRKNAVDSIALGIEDYKSTDERRIISATRNIVAGILLLIKSRLLELSPAGSNEVLIKKDIVPVLDADTGQVTWVGSPRSKTTVDVLDMKKRCESLKIPVDWDALKKITDERNNIEHYYTSQTRAGLNTLISSAFSILRDFIRQGLENEPVDVLGKAVWDELTSIASVHNAEKIACNANLDAFNWGQKELLPALKDYRCDKCGSDLVCVEDLSIEQEDVKFLCKGCGKTLDYEEVAIEAVNDFFAADNHYSIKDGGDRITGQCPNCFQWAYFIEKDVCLICNTASGRECKVCEEHIQYDDDAGMEEGLCGDCRHLRDLFERDD